MSRILMLIGFMAVAIDGYAHYPEVQQSYKFHRSPQKWTDARDTCFREDATLAMPKNEAEVSVLKKIFDKYPKSALNGVTHPDYFLLGFHDMFREGEYLTDKGESIQYYFHTWGNGQPDNAGNNENCGSLHRSGVINDYPCHISAVFICQKNKEEVKNITSLECASPDPAYKYSSQMDKCYKLHLNPKIWSDALAICKAEGGSLAIINNKTEEDFLVAMFTKPQDKVNHVRHKDFALLGFHDIFHESYFITVEGKELQSTGYTRWNPGQPDNAGGKENCGSMHISGALNDFPCHVPAVFFCENESNSYPSLDQHYSIENNV